jgi:hypothetical protein
MENEKKPLGVIDALSNGFILVAQHPWVLLIPLLLDFFLWLQPPIIAKPVFDQMLALTNDPVAQAQITPEMKDAFDTMQSTIQTAGNQFDVLVVVAWAAVGMPSLQGADVMPMVEAPAPWFVIDNILVLFMGSVLLSFVGILVSSLYLEILARGVRHDSYNWIAFVPRVLRSYFNLLALAVLLVVLFFVIMIPVAIGASLLSMLSQGLASFLIILMTLAMIWAGLYLAFALPAIFVSGSNPIQAILNSIMVFRFNVGSAVGLVVLTYVIQMGFSIIWQQLPSGPAGIVFMVIANAFIGTGLMAALMLFYQDRLMWLLQLRARVMQQRPDAKG